MDMSKIQRALGFLEGVCIGLKDKDAELIETAVNEIDCELENRNHDIAAPIKLDDVQFEEGDCLTSRDVEELTERLKKHFMDYQNGRCQKFEVVCRDCLMASLAITQLGNALKDTEYGNYMGRP